MKRAFTFLKLKEEIPIIEIVKTNQIDFGIRWIKDRRTNTIYIEQGRINETEELEAKLREKYGENGDLDIFARLIIHALAGGSARNLSEVERQEKEFDYAYDHFKDQVIARFPSPEALPGPTMARIENSSINIWGPDGELDPVKVRKLKKDLNLGDDISFSKNASEETVRFNEEMMATAKALLYKMSIKALNGVINQEHDHMRASEDDPELTGTENIRAGVFAFAANLPSDAHTD